MMYLTRAEYAGLKGCSRQAVHDAIKHKRLPIVMKKDLVERIVLEDADYEELLRKALTRSSTDATLNL